LASLRTYIIARLLMVLPMILILLSIVFLVLHVLPGDPVSAMLGPKAPEEQKELMRHQLGLDKHPIFQYADYIVLLSKGDFGTSILMRRPVLAELLERFPATLELTITSMIIAILIGVLAGAHSAYKQGSAFDHGYRFYAIVLWSMPIFWLGMLFQLFFGVYLGWLPMFHRDSPLMAPQTITGLHVLDSILSGNLPALSDSVAHLVLPSFTLGTVLSGIFVRLTRANMVDTLRQDYIAAARARGLPERVVVLRHALKNSFIPVLTMMGLQFALMLGGAALTERTFSWPGVATYLIERIYYRDFPAIQGAIVFYAVLVVMVSTLVDIVYAYIDPRIRY